MAGFIFLQINMRPKMKGCYLLPSHWGSVLRPPKERTQGGLQYYTAQLYWFYKKGVNVTVNQYFPSINLVYPHSFIPSEPKTPLWRLAWRHMTGFITWWLLPQRPWESGWMLSSLERRDIHTSWCEQDSSLFNDIYQAQSDLHTSARPAERVQITGSFSTSPFLKRSHFYDSLLSVLIVTWASTVFCRHPWPSLEKLVLYPLRPVLILQRQLSDFRGTNSWTFLPRFVHFRGET